MAVEPLYVDKALLLQNLRMTASTDTETLTLIDRIILDVRVSFYRRLTPARAQEIASLPSVDNPTTVDEILRSTAENTDMYWVMWKLLCILPVMYIETEFAVRDNFGDVPITRDADSLKNYIACLKNSVEVGLGQMEIPVNDNAGDFQSFSAGASKPSLLSENFIGKGSGCSW